MTALDYLTQLYEDNKACAELVGLSYVESEDGGISRRPQGKGFTYRQGDRNITDKVMKKRIAGLVIPPAWQDVWISPDDQAHVLATGIDEKGRKQYIYHPRWRTMRDLIKFYRMILFARALPKIRQVISRDLERPALDHDKVIGCMLWLLDNTYLRVGNDLYLNENDSVGLTTLSDKNLVVAGDVTTLSFVGKSGKQQQVTFEDKTIADVVRQLIDQRGSRLFRYRENSSFHDIDAADVNAYLHGITEQSVSAKDFRTWGGTLMAFNHLVETYRQPKDRTPKPAEVVIEAVDAAANVLGNTRAIARNSYVHPHILETYARRNFAEYYEQSKQRGRRKGLDARESELAAMLELLFEKEFNLLKQK